MAAGSADVQRSTMPLPIIAWSWSRRSENQNQGI